MNFNKDANELSIHNLKYFQSRIPEEDYPIEFNDDLQDNYQRLEILYDSFFDSNFLTLAKQTSKEERDVKKLNDSSYVYGEITFRSMAYIFEYVKYIYGQNSIIPGLFFDLGSGVGKGLIAASFLHNFQKIIGIEYLENLHNMAIGIKQLYDDEFEKILFNNKDIMRNVQKKNDLEIINGDFLQYDWSEAGFLLANSTCFSPELMGKLSEKAENELRKGAIFVTFTKKLPNLTENWEIKDGFRRVMSWGIATVYVHRKIN